MSNFLYFYATHKPAIHCSRTPHSVVSRYESKLPKALTDSWRTMGFCGYADGLIWTVNPLLVNDLLDDWLVAPENSATVIARTAFGDLVFWFNKKAVYLDVRFGRQFELTSDIDILFGGILCESWFLDQIVQRPLFLVARSRLRRLAPDECYGFFPALALGGPGTAETLQIVKLREHVSFLAQLFR